MKNINKEKGFTFTELIIGMAMLLILMTAVASVMYSGVKLAVNTRHRFQATALCQTIMTRLKGIEYVKLFASDSSQTNQALYASYPYIQLLNSLKTEVVNKGFTKFTVELVFMRRDVTDINHNSSTSDLVSFTDTNGDLVDDYDPSIKYIDCANDAGSGTPSSPNPDGDKYDTYTDATLGTCTEEPNTHIKQVTVKIYDGTKVVQSLTELISWEKYSGVESKASGAPIGLLLTQPLHNSYLYDLSTTSRLNAFNLVIDKAYPTDVYAYPADSSSPIEFIGSTAPAATVHFYRNTTSPEIFNFTTGMVGDFDVVSSVYNAVLAEGSNRVIAQTTKGGLTSPLAYADVILDLNPPQIVSVEPASGTTVESLSPCVKATLTDTAIAAGATASGICSDVITMRNTTITGHVYNSTTGVVYWIDSVTGLPPVLANGQTYTITLQAGDKAHYKVSTTWSFTVVASGIDNSAPSIANKSPIGTTHEAMPIISVKLQDNQSGLNLNSIVLKLDGVVIVNSANLAQCWDPSTDTLSFALTSPLANGSDHTVEVTVSHWASDPADKVTSTESWDFHVSY